MFKRQMIMYVALFNVLMIVAFIFSNFIVWDYLNTEINLNSSHSPNGGGAIVPSIGINGFTIQVGHAGWTKDGTMIPMPAPTSILNYPFIVFWITLIGNLILIALILRKQIT